MEERDELGRSNCIQSPCWLDATSTSATKAPASRARRRVSAPPRLPTPPRRARVIEALRRRVRGCRLITCVVEALRRRIRRREQGRAPPSGPRTADLEAAVVVRLAMVARRTGARACPSQPRARPRRSSHPKRHRAQAAPASSVPATARCSIKSAMLRPPRVDSSRYELPCHLRPLPQLSVRLLLTRSIVPLAARAAMAVSRTSAVSPLPGSSSYARNAPPAGPLGREGGGSGRRRRGRARPPGGIWEEGASRSRARPPLRAHARTAPPPDEQGSAPHSCLLKFAALADGNRCWAHGEPLSSAPCSRCRRACRR